MNILCIGDVCSDIGMDYLCSQISHIKQYYNVDFSIANGENSDSSGIGISRNSAETLLRYVDVVTTGNHCFTKINENFYSENEFIMHPANLPFSSENTGYCCIDTGRFGTIKIVNLMGTAFMEPIDNPFICIDKILAAHPSKFTIVDFHAESTAEKKAMAFFLDGRISAIFGTHTHVQTADEQILPAQTGYITDVGMTGPVLSVIGIKPELSILRQRTHRPVRFEPASGKCMLNAVLFTLNEQSGMCTDILRLDWRGTPP